VADGYFNLNGRCFWSVACWHGARLRPFCRSAGDRSTPCSRRPCHQLPDASRCGTRLKGRLATGSVRLFVHRLIVATPGSPSCHVREVRPPWSTGLSRQSLFTSYGDVAARETCRLEPGTGYFEKPESIARLASMSRRQDCAGRSVAANWANYASYEKMDKSPAACFSNSGNMCCWTRAMDVSFMFILPMA